MEQCSKPSEGYCYLRRGNTDCVRNGKRCPFEPVMVSDTKVRDDLTSSRGRHESYYTGEPVDGGEARGSGVKKLTRLGTRKGGY